MEGIGQLMCFLGGNREIYSDGVLLDCSQLAVDCHCQEGLVFFFHK